MKFNFPVRDSSSYPVAFYFLIMVIRISLIPQSLSYGTWTTISTESMVRLRNSMTYTGPTDLSGEIGMPIS